ncbi:MAG TPA: DUF6438 domain-containing protein [Gemmatimonadaceae bacterium]
MRCPRSATVVLVAVSVGVSLVACTPSVRTDVPAVTVDSLVLERTLCYGTCAAYRLSLGRDGQVAFQSRNPGDEARQVRDTTAAVALSILTSLADSLGFVTLPDTIANSPALCPGSATDHPTATVTIFRAGASKHVVDYLGCFAGFDHSTVPIVGRLRILEASIDSLAGSKRWVHPAKRR